MELNFPPDNTNPEMMEQVYALIYEELKPKALRLIREKGEFLTDEEKKAKAYTLIGDLLIKIYEDYDRWLGYWKKGKPRFLGSLHRAIQNLNIDQFNKRKNQSKSIVFKGVENTEFRIDDHDLSSEEELINTELYILWDEKLEPEIEKYKQSKSKRQQFIFDSYFYMGMTVPQIAKTIGTTTNSCATTLKRMKDELSEIFHPIADISLFTLRLNRGDLDDYSNIINGQ